MNKPQITEKLLKKHQEFAEFVSNLSERVFIFASENKWSAGQQFDHLLRGVSPVKMALGLPKIVPNLLFGKANRISLDYENLVAEYQAKLASGSKATGRFIPPTISFDQRERLKSKLLTTVNGLCQKVESFDDSQLDEYLLPHPILGKLTFREMLYFTIYHVEHHHQNIIKNLEKR